MGCYYDLLLSEYDEDEKDATGKTTKRSRRKFVMNTRGFMGITSMDTAKLVDEYVCVSTHVCVCV